MRSARKFLKNNKEEDASEETRLYLYYHAKFDRCRDLKELTNVYAQTLKEAEFKYGFDHHKAIYSAYMKCKKVKR